MSDVSLISYTPVTSTSQVNFTGLGNGTDFNQLISKLVAVEQSRLTKYQTWKQTWILKQECFEKLNSALVSLQTTLEDMDTLADFLAKSSLSSDASIVSVLTSAGAEDGSHSIEVQQLAAAKSMVTTTGYASADTDINNSNASVDFSYVYEGTVHSISVGANCTLSELAGLINNDAENPGVKASLVNDGTNYYLQLRGMDTGADATLAIASNSALIGFGASDFETVASNCDALLRIDGWPTSSYISRDSNSIADLVEGVTLNLKNTGTVTVTTSTDTGAVKSNIQTFVEEMNTVRSLVKELTDVDMSTAKGSILTGNYGVNLIGSRLETVVASPGLGFDRTDDTYSVLSQLGIYTDADEGSDTEGLLLISNATLDAILLSNADAVAKLFADNYAGSTDTSAFAIYSYIGGTTGYGTFDVSYTTDADGKITAATINGHQALFSSNSSLITGAYGYAEAGLVLNCIDTTPNSTINGTVSLRQGKLGELADVLDVLTDSADGPLHILDENYDDIVSMIDDKIAYEQTRIANYATRLRTKFAKVDSLLSVYTDQQSALSSFIDQLSS